MTEHNLQTKLAELRETVARQADERGKMLSLLEEILRDHCIEHWLGKDLVGRIRKTVKACGGAAGPTENRIECGGATGEKPNGPR